MLKKVLIPFVILVVLGGLAWWLSRQDSGSTIDREDTDFAVTDTAAIDQIIIQDRRNNEVKLSRESGKWLVNDQYKASQTKIQTLLTTIKEVEVKNPVPKSAKENVIKNMATNNLRVEIYKDGSLAQAYFVGHQTNDELGTYMAIDNENKKPYVTHIPGFEGYLTPRFFTDITEWRTTEVFSYNPVEITSVEVEYPQKAGEGFQLMAYGNGEFSVDQTKGHRRLENPKSKQIKKYLLGFEDVHFIRTLEKSNQKVLDSLSNVTPAVKIAVESSNQPDKTLKLYPINQDGPKKRYGPEEVVDPEKFYAIASNRPNNVMIIQKQALEQLIKSFNDFESAKKP